MSDVRAYFAGLSLLLGGCSGEAAPAERVPPAGPAALVEPDTGARGAVSDGPLSVPFRSAAEMRESGALARVVVRGHSALVLADEDGGALTLLDDASGRRLTHTPLPCAPHQVLATARGELFVTLPRCNVVARFELRTDGGELSLRETARRAVAAEPVALSATRDGSALLVVSAWGGTLTRLSLPRLEPTWAVPLAREPRAVTVSDDGERALVSHAMGGVLSEVSLTTQVVQEHSLSARHQRLGFARSKRHWHHESFFDGDFVVPHGFRHRRPARPSLESSELFAAQGFSLALGGDRVWIPQVLSNPGKPTATPSGYGAFGSPLPSTLQDVATFDLDSGSANRDAPFAIVHGWKHSEKNVCRLPRAAAFDAERSTLLVACTGTDRVLEFDAEARDPARTELSAWTLPRGPSGIALDAANRRAHVWSRFARTISVLELGAPKPERPAEMSPQGEARRRAPTPEGRVLRSFVVPPPTPFAPERELVLAGLALFHRAGDPAISADGRACASCHPAGRDDGLAWRTDGALHVRQTPMLDGRIADTAPYGWLGEHTTLEEHLTNTILHRLLGKGVTPAALQALSAYLRALPGPPSTEAEPSVAAVRGRALYHRSDVGCADCHDDDGGVDRQQHAVTERTATDTPSLRFIAGAAPFFHDGKYQTLDDVLLHTQGNMGQARALSPLEREDLVAYLRTL